MEKSYQISISDRISYKDIEKFLIQVLHFEKYRDFYGKSLYRYYKNEDYKFYSGIYAEIIYEYYWQKTVIELGVGINDYSFTDIEYLNYSYEQIIEYFKEDLIKDENTKQSLFKYDGIERKFAESGCYLSYDTFQNNLGKIKSYSLLKSFPNFPPPSEESWKNDRHPEIISNNLIVPFLISSIEGYFRDTFLALLKYSEKRIYFYKKYGNKIIDEFENINLGQITINEALCNYISFQNLSLLCDNFKQLDKKIDLYGFLVKKSFFDLNGNEFMEFLISMRHDIIHHSMFENYLTNDILSDIIDSIDIIISEFYNHLIKVYKWKKIE